MPELFNLPNALAHDKLSLSGDFAPFVYNINATIFLCQTLPYGIYLCLFLIAIHVMFTNGLQSRARKWLVTLTTFVFALSTVYYILSYIFTFTFLDYDSALFTCDPLLDIKGKFKLLPYMARWLETLGNILFINFIVADGIIVWRALVLCSDQSRIVLMIPVVMLIINTVTYLMAVAMTAIVHVLEKRSIFLDILPVNILAGTLLTHLALSLLINISATSIIAIKAWKYHKLLMESGIGIRTPRQAIRILAVLVESGVIYILIGIMIFSSIFMFLHFSGASTSIFMPVAQQLVAIYPVAVVLLVEKHRSLDYTISSFGAITDAGGARRPSQTLDLERGPALASCGQIDLISPGNSKNSDSIEDHAIF